MAKVIETKRDKNNNKVWEKYEDGGVAKWRWDDRGNLIRFETPSGDICEFEFNSDNKITGHKLTLNNGDFYKYETDENGEVINIDKRRLV